MTTTGTAPSNEQLLITDLEQTFKLTPAQAAGVAGNIQEESGFSTTSYNPNENAHGLENWEGRRWTLLQNYSAKNNLAPTSIYAQLGYLNSELQGPYKNVLADLRNATSPSQAAYIFDTEDERSTAASIPARESNANSIYSQIIGGKPLTGGGGAGSGNVPIDATLTGITTSVPSNLGPIPGWVYDPLDLPGEVGKVLGNLSGGATSAVAGAIESALADIAHPLFTFAVNAGLVILGLIVIVIAFVLLAHSDDGNNSTPPAAAAAPAAKSTEAEEAAAA